VKTNEKAADELGKVFYHEIKGTEDSKISYCRHGSIDEAFKQVEFGSDDCFFYPQDVDLADTYNNTNTTFDLDQLFEIKTVGVLTQSDTLVLDTNADRLVRKVSAYKENNILPDSPSDHLKSFDHKTLVGSFENAENKKNMLEYRPFDDRFFYDSNVVARSKKKLNAHASIEGNVFFNFTHTCLDDDFRHVFFTEKTPECKLFKGARSTHTAPLFVYAETPNTTKNGALFTSSETKSNINQSVFNKFQMVYGNIKPLDVLDYVYGVLNDADYVSTYNELLKSNYPRVPYPQTKEELDRFAEKGARLRQVHLEKKKTDTLSTYQAVENNTIEKVEYDEANQRIWFNNNGYFDHITKEMWAYKIGAVNPLASWLEARCKAKDVFDRQMVGVYQNVIYRVRNSI
jgi:predicted helicase